MSTCDTIGYSQQDGILVCGLNAGHNPQDRHRDVEKSAWFFTRD